MVDSPIDALGHRFPLVISEQIEPQRLDLPIGNHAGADVPPSMTPVKMEEALPPSTVTRSVGWLSYENPAGLLPSTGARVVWSSSGGPFCQGYVLVLRWPEIVPCYARHPCQGAFGRDWRDGRG